MFFSKTLVDFDLPLLIELRDKPEGEGSRIWLANAVNNRDDLLPNMEWPYVTFEVSQEAYDRYMKNRTDLLTLQKETKSELLAFDYSKISSDGEVIDTRVVEPHPEFYPDSGFYARDHTQ